MDSQFKKSDEECKVSLDKLYISLSKIENLEKQLHESNDIVKRSKCTEHITQMTPIFRKRRGLGFLNEPLSQSSLGDQKGKETVFVKAGASTSAKPEIKENFQKNKTFSKRVFMFDHCGKRGHLRPFCYELNNNSYVKTC